MSDISKDLKKYYRNCQRLKNLQKQTCLALQDISSNLQLGRQIKNELFSDSVAEKLLQSFSRTPAFLVFGQSCHAKALIVNSLLDQAILPLSGTQWRYIRFKHGSSKLIRTTYDNEYEFLDRLHADEKPWVTVPEEDLQRDGGECPLDVKRTVEVEIPHPLLGDNVHILVPPDGECLVEVLRPTSHLQNNVPIVIYAICEELSDRDVEEIRKLKLLVREPFLFISIKDKESMRSTESLTESEQHSVHQGTLERVQNLRDKLVRLGYISDTMVANPDLVPESQDFPLNSFLYINGLTCDIKVDDNFVLFVQEVLKYNELKMANVLSEIHNNCLRKFILSAFDMAREIQITPKRIEYAQTIEMKLYENLMKIAAEQQEQITSIIQRTLQEMKANVEIVFEDEVTQNTKRATLEIQQLVLKRLRNSVASQIVESVDCLQDSFTGTLQRCLESLEKKRQDKKRHDLEGSLSASDSVKQILSAAYSIDLRSSQSSSVVHTFMDRLRTLLANIVSPWSSSSSQNQCDLQWQLQVVTNILDSLSASRLAKTISTQFQEHVRSSHEAFQSAIRSLENQLSGQLEQTEEQRVLIRKRHAPRLARLTLESTSLCDRVVHGMPKQIREIGRGQYGVVFSCEPWGGVNPCAFKSVVPPDDRHWNDLAMEFYYTRTIAEHPRIVKLRGSVIDYAYGYGGGNSASVLLIMERMTRDLHCGLRSGLTWVARLRIAIDVIEGIRYLHSQGLVHRDIKLKNVLLDNDDRAKLTDFGFCIPEAMMSGSVVGTPVHMAPELLSGRYDSSVDVYAFGILFWYICAGQVKLPNHFDHFQNKEQLWSSVRKGIRPECLSQFNRACWNLMEHCWAAEPSERPLLGDVQPQLEAIYQNALSTASSSSPDDAKG